MNTATSNRVSEPAAVLEGRALTKHYGAVRAVTEVDIRIRAGEILAIVGDNGAGKSTLVKMLCGAIQPDDGEIVHRGERVVFESPHDARLRGIETVWQELALDGELDVAGNVYLGRETVRRPHFLPRMLRPLDRRAMVSGAKERLDALEVTVPTLSGLSVSRLSGGQRQAVAVARAAAWASDVLFMDEPTAALGVRQSTAVLELARRVAKRGLAVVMITHAMPHVMEFADRVVVLRHGKKVADLHHHEATPERLIALIVGFEQGESAGE